MEKTIWKEMPDFPGYFVSNTGLVRHNNYILDASTNYHRGKRFTARNGKIEKKVSVARAVAFTFYEKDLFDTSLTVDHIDGNRMNNNLSNLQLMSYADNLRKGTEEGFYYTRKTKVINKKTGEVRIFISATKASEYVGKEKSYVNGLMDRGLTENKDYIFEVYPRKKWRFVNGLEDYTKLKIARGSRPWKEEN